MFFYQLFSVDFFFFALILDIDIIYVNWDVTNWNLLWTSSTRYSSCWQLATVEIFAHEYYRWLTIDNKLNRCEWQTTPYDKGAVILCLISSFCRDIIYIELVQRHLAQCFNFDIRVLLKNSLKWPSLPKVYHRLAALKISIWPQLSVNPEYILIK